MIWRRSVLLIILWILANAQTAVVLPAHAFETELRAAAGSLVNQLEAAGQKNGTVLDFTDLQGQGTELGRFLSQELADRLVSATRSISFVDRMNLQFLLRENKLSVEGLVDPESSRKLGKMIGIDTIIIGSVTPFGKSVRLSIRAVAVETGKIVASQSTTIPITGELADLYTHGLVVGGVTQGNQSVLPAKAPDVRERFRSDSIRMTASQGLLTNVQVGLSFTIENKSGIPISIGALQGATSLGPCQMATMTGISEYYSQYVDQIKSNQENRNLLRYVPSGGHITVAATFYPYNCGVQRSSTLELSTSLVIFAENQVFIIPSSVSVQIQ
jgi:curli biogenesis system outer membrane secretion channel CsgG